MTSKMLEVAGEAVSQAITRLQRRLPPGSAFCVRPELEFWAEGQSVKTGNVSLKLCVTVFYDDEVVRAEGTNGPNVVEDALEQLSIKRLRATSII